MTEIEKLGELELAQLAEEINAEHRAFVGTFRKTVEHGIRAGELLAEAKSQCLHGTWLPWLEANFEGSARAAQEYMRLYNHRDEVRAKTRDSAFLSVSGALMELAATGRPEGIPPEEWEIVRRGKEEVWFLNINTERLAALPEVLRRGFVAEMAWGAMVYQALRYLEARDALAEEIYNATPDMLTKVQDELNKLRWWVEQSEWIETLVRAWDWPPSMGMPQQAFDEETRYLPLCELYNDDDEGVDGLSSPRSRIRAFCGPVV